VNAPPTTAKERMAAKRADVAGKALVRQAQGIVEPVFWPDKGSAWVPSILTARIGKNAREWRWCALGHNLLSFGAMAGPERGQTTWGCPCALRWLFAERM